LVCIGYAEGFWLPSYTIITTDPNEAMQAIHDGMSAILDPREYDEWLDRTKTERPLDQPDTRSLSGVSAFLIRLPPENGMVFGR